MHDRKHRHEHAMQLFAVEEREQDLFAIGFAATRSTGNTANAPMPGDGNLPSRLSDLERDADADILASHHRLRAARAYAERMAIEDPELARLNALVNGAALKPARMGEIIEGEVVEVASKLRLRKTPVPADVNTPTNHDFLPEK